MKRTSMLIISIVSVVVMSVPGLFGKSYTGRTG